MRQNRIERSRELACTERCQVEVSAVITEHSVSNEAPVVHLSVLRRAACSKVQQFHAFLLVW